MADVHLLRVGKHRRQELFFGADGDIHQRQHAAQHHPKGARVVPLVGAEIEVDEDQAPAASACSAAKKLALRLGSRVRLVPDTSRRARLATGARPARRQWSGISAQLSR
jgi:hypothetical protein